jgi:hypothetical protein
MGLAVNVGALAYAIKHDPEGGAHLRDCFATINSLLAVFHISRHQEPEQLPPLQSRAKVTGYPCSYLHHLRRIYARTIKTPGWQPIPVPPGQDAAKDPVFRSSSLKIRAAGQTDPFWIEKLVWLSLFEAARLSVEYKTAIWFQ